MERPDALSSAHPPIPSAQGTLAGHPSLFFLLSSPTPTPTPASGSLPVFLELSLHEARALACGWIRGWGGEAGQPVQSPQGPRNPSSPASPTPSQGLWGPGAEAIWRAVRTSRESLRPGMPQAIMEPFTAPQPLQASAYLPHPPKAASPLLTSPPPALTLPGGRGGEERPQATKGEGGKGSWLLPGAVGVKPPLPQNPQFLVVPLLKRGRPQVPPHLLSMTPALVYRFSGCIKENYEGDKRWRRKGCGHLPLPQPFLCHLWGLQPISHSLLLALYLGPLLLWPHCLLWPLSPLSATTPVLSSLHPCQDPACSLHLSP